MKTFKNFMTEMARSVVGDYNILGTRKERNENYEFGKNGLHIDYPVKDKQHIQLQQTYSRNDNEPMISYHTNDHEKKETLHISEIVKKLPTRQLPFEHEEQIAAHKYPNEDLPKGYGTNVVYNHFKNSKLPLKSSDIQYQGGHKMWERLAHRAMDEGHHVYYHDSKELIKSTPETIDDHLQKYYGKYPENKNKHMIISKKELG
ncbi:MAG: hypothetical protein PHG08_00260 [Bacilli bacterium]|nr:hypothetical protein [Bacilli bacterium]